MSPSDLSQIDITQLVQKPLNELGVSDAAALGELFARVEQQLRNETEPFSEEGLLQNQREALRVRWLGRKQGFITSIRDNWLRSAFPELKRQVGQSFNSLQALAENLVTKVPLGLTAQPEAKFGDWGDSVAYELGVDITAPGTRRAIGVQHPLRKVMEEITDIFLSLGYSVEEGPEIESTYYNFEALNIPENHPSRDNQDTFYIDPTTLLRTHTSPVQIRTMERQLPPLRIIVPGRVYRRDAPDATHSFMFHQVEGLAVDTHISFADLKGTLDYFLKAFFGSEVRTRFRPSFFPFTEPSAEVDISCLFCGSSGCRVCKQSGWIELLGCGMVDPALYSYVKYNPAKYSGFAFGMGVERLTMLKYGIPDIQLFYQGDVRFLHQFR